MAENQNYIEFITRLIEETKDNPDPLELSKPDVKNLLARSGASKEQLQSFDANFEEIVGEKKTLLASNIASLKKFEIETHDVINYTHRKMSMLGKVS